MKLFYRLFYRPIMKLAHKFNWHYAPPIYPDGDTHLWCQWCGFRQTIKKRDFEYVSGIGSNSPTKENKGEQMKLKILFDYGYERMSFCDDKTFDNVDDAVKYAVLLGYGNPFLIVDVVWDPKERKDK